MKKRKKKQEYRSPEEHFSEESYIEMPNSISFNYDDEEVINELYIADKQNLGKKSSIAYVNKNLDARYMKAPKAYATVKDYKGALKKGGVTNEAVKIDLTATYLQNPRKHTEEAIASILDSVNRHYTLTEEEEKLFSDGSEDTTKKRQAQLKELEKKGEAGDKKLVRALQACHDMLDVLGRVEAEQATNYGRIVQSKLEEQIREKCFADNIWLNIEHIPESEKKRLYKLALVVGDTNYDGLTEAQKSFKISQSIEAEQKLIDTLGKYYKEQRPPQSFIDKAFLSDPKIQKQYQSFELAEIKREREIAKENGKELSESDIEQIRTVAKSEFINSVKQRELFSSYKHSQMFLAVSDFIKEAQTINSLHNASKKAIEDSTQINKNIRANKNFVFLYEQMANATKAYKMDGKGAQEYEIKKVQREILFHYNNDKKFQEFIKNSEKVHNKMTDEKRDFESLLKKGVMSEQDFKIFSSAVLTEALKEAFDNERNNLSFTEQDRIAVGANLAKLANEIVAGKEERISGKPFEWGKIVALYDEFQEKNILDITKNRISELDGVEESVKKEFVEAIENEPKTSSTPSTGLKDEIVDIMNFNNIVNNKHIVGAIESDEIDAVIDQSLQNDNYKEFVKDGYMAKKNYSDAKKKDMSHDARIREVAGHYYSDYANSLMKNSIIGLASKRETFQNFSSCVKGASVMQRNMDTKLSNTTNCLKEFKNSLKKDADEFQREISASLQGVGALNPFMHIAQVVAISRKLMAERIEANMREIADSINGISKEVATAETEIERRARNTILMAKSDGNVNIQSVHNSEKDELSDKLKQEYTTREIVDFKEAKTKFSDADPLEILEEYEIQHRNLDDSKLKSEEIDPSIIGNVIGFADGTYTQQELSDKEEQIQKQKEGSELNQNDTEELSNQEHVSNTDSIEPKDGLANEDRAGKKEKLSTFNSAMIEDAILKMDKIQKKMAEMSLTSGNSYTHEEFLNGASSNKVTAKRLGFILSSEDEQKELGLESWESKEMRDWMRENDISKELLEKSLAKGHKVIEQEKLALNYQLIIKSLEEMRDKGGADAVRPESKLNDIIKEVEKLFSKDGEKMSKLEKRNTLSSAVNMLHGSANYKRTMETMFSTSSMETEAVKSEQNSEISILGVADKEKAYILKVHKEQKIEEQKRIIAIEKLALENESLTKEDIEEMLKREGFEDLSYKADIELLRGTKMVGSETSLNNWSDLLENSTNFTTYNNGVRDINQEMAQINNSAVDYTAESRGDVGRGGYIAPDNNEYAPSK